MVDVPCGDLVKVCVGADWERFDNVYLIIYNLKYTSRHLALLIHEKRHLGKCHVSMHLHYFSFILLSIAIATLVN